MPRKPTQSSAYAANPCADPGTEADATPSSTVTTTPEVSTPRRARRAVATDASWNWVSASWLSGTHPRPARKVRSSDSASTAATAGFPSLP